MSKVFVPLSLNEFWNILDNEPESRVYAGGTDLLVHLRRCDAHTPTLICLEMIDELKGVREEGELLWMGAGSTHAQLLGDPLVQKHLPLLVQALKTLGSPLIRNMGAIGGNICTASPAGDTLPPLYILDAELELHSHSEARKMPIQSFISGPGETALKKGEVLTGIRVRKPAGCNIHRYEKIGQRKAMACAIASMAAIMRISALGIIETARLAWGSVAPTIATFPEIEAALVGQRLSQSTLEQTAAKVRKSVSPIDDVRATAAYRREVAGNLLLRLTDSL
jgi:CO/xanthine dehydrogenase FAD-binding subunit